MDALVAHVIFDLDGTLIDSRADLAAALNHVLVTLGLSPLEPATVYGYVGHGARALVERALGPDHQELWEEGVRTFLAYYGEHLLDETTLYPGMGDALAALGAAGVALSVLTNKPEAMSRRILGGLGVLAWFVGVVGGDSLPTRKPDPAGALHLLRQTATPVDRALLVGDSSIDLATALSSGVPFCGVGWGLDPTAVRAAQAPFVSTAGDLVRLVLGEWP
jgi:phosphoglycolate phosphatase